LDLARQAVMKILPVEENAYWLAGFPNIDLLGCYLINCENKKHLD
jgi:hypothetical protein